MVLIYTNTLGKAECSGLTDCIYFRMSGLDKEDIYKYYVSGKDIDGEYVGLVAHKARGAAIGAMEAVWLGLWEDSS